MADGAPSLDYAAMPRAELIRRLELAQRWGRQMLGNNRALAKQVAELAADADVLRRQLAKAEGAIERAGQALDNLLADLEMGMIGEDDGGWDLAQRIRDEVGDDLGLGWVADLTDCRFVDTLPTPIQPSSIKPTEGR